MGFVFISHTSDDNPRVKALVEVLMDAGLKVWFDRPDLAGFSPDRIKSMYRVRAGGRWEDEMEDALRQASCVLVCWSKRAVGPDAILKRATWLREADYAQTERKLVCCSIDEVRSGELPGTKPGQHIICVNPDLPAERRAGALEILVADIRQKMQERNRARVAQRGFRDPFQPFLADRQKQEDSLQDAVCAVAEIPGVQPIISAAPANERPDEFCERICRQTALWLPDGAQWTQKIVDWPHGDAVGQEFIAAYRRNLWKAMEQPGLPNDQAIAMLLERDNRPTAVLHFVLASEWRLDERARVDAWLKFWQDLSELAQIRVVPWLQVKLPQARPGWQHKGCPAGHSGGRVAVHEIWRAMRELAAGRTGLVPSVPALMAPIQQGDAHRWIAKLDLEPAGRRNLEDHLNKLYGGSWWRALFRRHPAALGITHQVFADSLQPLFR